ncbi:MAG: isoaspartyl peptidase/L-asparaginase [Sphingobacteriales bacterium]|nr:MAG: isoaspartyl peptidase/L-asparaginase [Sphingobacteriales bacterium]
MRTAVLLLLATILSFASKAQRGDIKANASSNLVLVVHGGAGNINKESMTPEMEKAYKAGLQRALTVGYNILIRGGSSVDAVTAAVQVLEDDSLFNAGRGAVFTADGKNEMDACIMDGKTLKAGAVAGVTTVRNPISAARAVMEKSEHVMLSGKGADDFARLKDCEMADPSYFRTEARWQSLQRAKAKDSSDADLKKKKSSRPQHGNHDEKYGTVGAVALDMYGNLAAATSTGGMTNKKFGRIGDSPLIGAGTYADNNTCAISCTGWGEYFIRLVMAKSVSDRMELKGMSLEDAANEMIHQKLPALGGDGGLIAVDKKGDISTPFNTSGMYRGYIKSGGKLVVEIYK